jgi:hemolysin activation/secretion protein
MNKIKAAYLCRCHTETSRRLTTDKPSINFGRAIMLTLVLACLPVAGYAAAPPVRGDVPRPSDFVPELPEPGKAPEAPVETPARVLPEVPAVQPYGPRVMVKEILLKGNTVFSNEQLKEVTAGYEGRIITSSELEELRVALTRYYIDRGYLNSGAVLPDQKVVDGVIQMQIVEGELTEVDIQGNNHLASSYVEDRLRLGAGKALNINELQQQIQLMLESPVIQSINSALRPGDRPGEASLTSIVKEGPRFQFIPVIDNRLSPVLGEVRVLPQVFVYDMTGYGDILTTGVAVADGLTDAYANWSIPLNAHDTTLSLFVDYTDSEIKEGDFEVLELENTTKTAGFRITHPFYRVPGQKFSMSLGMDVRSSESDYIFGPYNFAPGVPENGEVDLSIIRFSQDWTKRGQRRVLAARSMFSFGIDAFDATINSGNDPSGEYFAWLGQFQWAQLVGEDMGQVLFRANVQWTDDSLFSMEQFSIGGALSVRGYRENQLLGDEGYNASLEYRYPLMKDVDGRDTLTLAPFFDAGQVCYKGVHKDLYDEPPYIYSAGLGLRWDPTKKIHTELYWGHAFHDIDTNDNDGVDTIQDDGIHFLISANLLEWF